MDPGDDPAMDQDEALSAVYDELRKLANAHLAGDQGGQSLQPTDLVHEVYLRLARDRNMRWNGRGHFFGAAARAMRRILVERARRRKARKRGGDYRLVTFDDDVSPRGLSADELLALHDALERLEAEHPRRAQIVLLRCFAGLTVNQIADDLEVNPRTVERDWRFAKAWLGLALAGDE